MKAIEYLDFYENSNYQMPYFGGVIVFDYNDNLYLDYPPSSHYTSEQLLFYEVFQRFHKQQTFYTFFKNDLVPSKFESYLCDRKINFD